MVQSARRRSSILILILVLGLGSVASAASGGVRIVTPAGDLDFPTIQAAVDAAVDGDVLLVGPGSHAAFIVDGKGLSIHAAQAGQASVAGSVVLRNLPADRTLLLEGLLGKGTKVSNAAGLQVIDCAGLVRIERCSFTGSSPNPGQAHKAPGHSGARVAASFRVLFQGTTLIGSPAYGDSSVTLALGEKGGDGLSMESGAAALYDCALQGGLGGLAAFEGGPGGHGARVVLGGLFASGSTSIGGKGGLGEDVLPAQGGDGGHGLRLESSAQAQLVDNNLAGGAGGDVVEPSGFPGAPGLPLSAQAGAVVVQHPGAARRFLCPPIAGDVQSIDVQVEGEPGDGLHLLRGLQAAWKPALPTTGILTLVPFPKQLYFPLGTLTGMAGTVSLPLPDLGPSTTARQLFAQGLAAPIGGGSRLGSPFTLLVLGRSAPPDCDGNGVNDYLDMVEGNLPDCDANLVPDACDIAGGLDCNGNGEVDACDIAAGTSSDRNQNGVPDECEANGVTWYVDAAAPPGGNGSHAFPFQSISAGVSIALSGDTVLVADGLYTGPLNRNMSFGGRDIVVVSARGPANCIVDAQGSGRAFEFLSSHETRAARLEGLTIRNGNANLGTGSPGEGGGVALILSDVSILGCIFDSNVAPGGGGGLKMHGSASQVRECVFVNNAATSTQGFGGAVLVRSNFLFGTEIPEIVECVFDSNFAGQQGGAVGFLGDVGAITHCTFTRNQAGVYGGGLYLLASTRLDVVVSECLIAGNTAQHGGGIAGSSDYQVLGCTVVANTASGSGGGIFEKGTHGSLIVVDSVLWGNSAPLGLTFALDFGGSATVSYSDLEGGAAAVSVGSGSFVVGAGLIDVDPLFANPDGADGDPLTFADNDYRLGAGSSCVDFGHNGFVAPDIADLDGDGNKTEPVPFDLDGSPRFVDDPLAPDLGVGTPPFVDLGAYERP